MPAVDLHPAREDLEAFALGRLDDDTHVAVEEHVNDCSACQQIIDRVPGDALVVLLRAAGSMSDTIKAVESDTSTDSLAPVSAESGSKTSPWVPAEAENAASLPVALLAHPRYEPTRLLGSGGMGTVWLAQHRVMGRQVALKVIRPEFVAKPGAAERFHREAQAAARLHHPNIVAAFDAENADDTHLLAMEYVEGIALADLLQQRGPQPVTEACDAARQAALGLQHAFECGLIHRDLKPHNLMRTPDGTVKILDFGLAVLADANRSTGGLTGENVVLGTPDYIAPEQAENSRDADVRSDIYSLGCTLYHLLTGRVPFPGESVLRKLDGHRTREPEPIRSIRPEVPAELATIVTKMMAKKPADRFQTPAEVAAALAPFAAGTAPVRKHRRPWVAVAALLLAGIVAAAGVVYRIQTNNGELVITTDNQDVEVVIKQNGKLVRIIDTKTNKEVKLDSGLYELELKGNPEELKLSLDKVTIRRGETVVATVERRPKAHPESEIDVACAPAPKEAVILFDGTSLAKWEKRGGGEATWKLLRDGAMEGRGGDIITKEKFGGNFKLHVEFRVPSMPNESGQRRGNSGVYIQGRYEVQILDSYGIRPKDTDCGAIYRFAAPLVNACKAPTIWQSYDIEFTAPVCKDGKKVELGRMTVYQNRVLIHDDVKLTTDSTPEGLGGDPCMPGPILLQGLGAPVQFRNIWLVRADGKVGEARQPARPKAERITGVDIAPDCSYYLVAYQNPHSVHVCERSGKIVHQLKGYLGRFTPDGKRVITIDSDCTLRAYDLVSGQLLRQFQDTGHVLNFQLSGDGSRMLCDLGVLLRVYDAKDFKALCVIYQGKEAAAFLTPDGKHVLQSGSEPPLRVFDAETGKRSEAYPQLRNLSQIIGFSTDGSRLVRRLVRRDGTKLQVYDVPSGKEVNAPFDAGEGGFGQLSPDGRLLLATSGDFRNLYLWFIQGGGVWDRRELSQKIDPKQMRIAFSSDGRCAVAAINPQTVYWFDVDRQLWPKPPAEPAKP